MSLERELREKVSIYLAFSSKESGQGKGTREMDVVVLEDMIYTLAAAFDKLPCNAVEQQQPYKTKTVADVLGERKRAMEEEIEE